MAGQQVSEVTGVGVTGVEVTGVEVPKLAPPAQGPWTPEASHGGESDEAGPCWTRPSRLARPREEVAAARTGR